MTTLAVAIAATMAMGAAGSYTPNKWVTPDADGFGDGVLTPWTWQQAFTSSMPGDVIHYAAGTYYAPHVNTDRLPQFVPNAGTVSEPIIHYADTRAVFTANDALRSKWRLDGSTGPVAGMNDYVTFDGFDVAQIGTHTIASEGHSFALWFLVGAVIKHCRFEAVLSTVATGTNWGAIYAEDVTDLEISDCEITGFNGTAHHNHSAIMLYDVENFDVHHCAFTNCAGAVFPKGVQDVNGPDLVPGTVHHCKMTNVNNPLPLGGVGQNTATATPTFDFYQNLLVNSGMITTRAHPRNVRIVNNTLVAPVVSDGVFYTPAAYAVTDSTPVFNYSMFGNNLVVFASGGALWTDYEPTATLAILAARMPFDYNMYRGMASYHRGSDWATWRAAGMDAHGVEDDPLFIDEVGGDYRLSALSPALGAGLDTLNLAGGGSINLGCYILPDQSDQIGVRAA